ncbi:hypothetical protein AB0C88_37895 [Streptomyces chartreusis]|uniref:hypothetical protein n=1 Tax=Streptomyces chartreusis TaxID=1969 RepID=UPI00340E14A2
MNAFSQTPQRPVPLHKATLPQTEFVDNSSDVWQPAGHNGRGELLLTCSSPREQRDAGDGESYQWTLHEVQQSFGPLMARSAVAS